MKAKSLLTVVLIALVLTSTVSGQNLISVDGITNVIHDSVLQAGQGHAVAIRYQLNGVTDRNYLTSNGFKIYSPDGADWEYVQGLIMPDFSSITWDATYLNHYTKFGGSGVFGSPQSVGSGNTYGNDTVAVLLAGVNVDPGAGLTDGYNAVTLMVEFGARREDNGLHICIDTCAQVPGGWEWANPDGLIEPDWAGPVCWVVTCCSGKVGDVNGSGEDEPTIGDVSALIDILFISEQPGDCVEEADINLSGTLLNPPLDWKDVTIGDISFLIEHLFITPEGQPPLYDCP